MHYSTPVSQQAVSFGQCKVYFLFGLHLEKSLENKLKYLKYVSVCVK